MRLHAIKGLLGYRPDKTGPTHVDVSVGYFPRKRRGQRTRLQAEHRNVLLHVHKLLAR